MLFSSMLVALSRIRGQRYNYPIGGIALWRPIAIITGMDAKDRIIAEQSVLIVELRREIEGLKLALAKATKDSSNSSKSPSSDIVKPPKKGDRGKAVRERRKRGGQPGRKRTLRQPLPPERVDETFVYEMTDAP
jgi:hypothetical protein